MKKNTASEELILKMIKGKGKPSALSLRYAGAIYGYPSYWNNEELHVLTIAMRSAI